MLCGFTCLILNCVLHCKINFFRIGLFIKIEEPTVLGINMFSAPSLTLKSVTITLLYWTVIQTVGFILFQVKPFWFGWRSIDIRPIDFALLAPFAFLEHLAHSNQWHIKELHNYCCRASVASEQQHKQDLRRKYKRENEFSKSSLFTRMLCGFLPECIAPSTRVHCAMNNTRLWHCCNGVLFLRGLQLRQVSGYGFTCKAMWARSCLAFTTLAVVVNAEFESLETLDD